MPEGPELYFASRFINSICKSRIFSGKLKKSEISKCPSVTWNAETYTISAVSRGKELKLTLKDTSHNKHDKDKSDEKDGEDAKQTESRAGKSIDIVFRFGLSGRFRFDPVEEIHKHAHLTFLSEDKKMVLSFVDQMRFGTWDATGKWNRDRGPCVLFEYETFRDNVLKNLKSSVFNRPICEVLLNQKYFNGIGNYLRAEILFRAGIPPFVKARDVLESLDGDVSADATTETPDILQLCHTLANEVISLTNDSGYDADDDTEDSSAFSKWLRCYYKPDMKNMVDHNNRTIWFSGPPGPLTPKIVKERHTGKPRKKLSKAAFKSSVPNPTEHSEGSGVTSEDSVSDVAGHMSPDHDYRPQGAEETRPNKPPPDKGVVKEKTIRQESAAEGCKRTNAHDWPSSPRKLRSSRKQRADPDD